MWPWGHAAVGYLLYSWYCRRTYDRSPTSLAVVFLGLGTQFPDLVDKPLAWSVAVLPTGRSLAHSLFTATVVIALGGYVARRHDRPSLAVAFGLGYLSHLATDALHPLLRGDFGKLTYLVWPVLPLPVYETEKSFLAHFLAFELAPFTLFEFGLVALAVVVWVADDLPGVPFVGQTSSES